MKEPKQSRTKRARAQTAEPKRPNGQADTFAPHAHLIHIPDRAARLRANLVLGRVQVPHCCFSDNRYLVTNEHLDALRREAIPFELVP
jgi:hypothetical protein